MYGGRREIVLGLLRMPKRNSFLMPYAIPITVQIYQSKRIVGETLTIVVYS